MAVRIRVPLVVDLLVCSDPGEIAEIEATPTIDRTVRGGRGLLNGALARRIDPGLRFDDQLLRVFRHAMDPTRIDDAGQSAPLPPQRPLSDRKSIERLREAARWVAGYPSTRPIACAAQELLVGRFLPRFRSSPDTARDGQLVARWLDPWTLLGIGRRRRERAKRRLYSTVEGNLDTLHAASFATESLVDALRQMRRLVTSDRARVRLSTAEAIERCLQPPPRALRATQAQTHLSFREAPLPAGVVCVLLTRRAHRKAPAEVSPFASGAWNACPGETMVRALLQAIWETRRVDVPIVAPRVWPYERLARFVGERLLGRFTWHKLPGLLGVIRLIGFRDDLRRVVLLDPEPPPRGTLARPTRTQRDRRSADGRSNDLDLPDMGAAGKPFGRNVAPAPPTLASLLTPSPRQLSLDLMTRHAFKPAPTLNVLAAAWIQFMVHGWFNHAPDETRRIDVPPTGDPRDPWPEETHSIPATRASAMQRLDPALAPVFDNTETHWWDASQLYGSTRARSDELREGVGGRLLMPQSRLPVDGGTGLEKSGFTDNWWIGLGVLHTLFALEHNAICGHLERHHPEWDDDELFARARLVMAALLAKIHTLEWTPAILDHPALHITMRSTWSGITRGLGEGLFGRRRPRSDLWRGVPGSESTHHGVRYAMTEEFVSVYRMHQLLPDEIVLNDAVAGAELGRATLAEVIGVGSVGKLRAIGLENGLYSLGIANAGEITLDNYPRALQRLVRPGQPEIDLAAVDILRDRERGVPRYNAFRRAMQLAPVERFEDLCDDPEVAERVQRAYAGQIEDVDLQIGMCVERKPSGFGFGETAFRIFTLMAVRRLKSDRFFTTHYDEGTYSKEGLDWVAQNTFGSVLERHAPAAAAAMRRARNGFAPWPGVGGRG